MKEIQTEKQFQRFDAFSRFLHFLVIISFLSLALTGMVIKFSSVVAFQEVSKFLGGYVVTGFIHRIAALITFLYFFLHIGYLIKKRFQEYKSFMHMLKGDHSLLPQMQDLRDFAATIKWFVGKGPRPSYGRWTYWEKFDYFAVFWGVAVIGLSGLILWFPEFFTSLGIPGSVINIATIIHSDEALLAAGFIFTYHFYNTHFRPDKFPMDPVIFTGCIPVDEFKYDRPREFEELVKNNPNWENELVVPPSKFFIRLSKVFGFSALLLGIFTVVLIIYSMLYLYN